jgi:hypothetical protein
MQFTALQFTTHDVHLMHTRYMCSTNTCFKLPGVLLYLPAAPGATVVLAAGVAFTGGVATATNG